MAETSLKWHEIINDRQDQEMPFLDLYREYATALREREEARTQLPYWPQKE